MCDVVREQAHRGGLMSTADHAALTTRLATCDMINEILGEYSLIKHPCHQKG